MKHDPFEDFVKDHRGEFDDLMPREDLFNGIKTKRGKIITLNAKVWISRVVAALVIFTIGFGASELLSSLNDNPDTKNAYSQDARGHESMDSSYRDFYEMQVYYNQQIDLVKNEIILLSNADAEINNEIDIELKELKTISDELQKDLEDHTNDQEVIDAMIMNYRVKLKMLEEMKKQLEPSTNYSEEEDYETVDI